MKKLIVINFKSYKESIGENAIRLAKKLDHKNVWFVVNSIDLKEVVNSVKYSKVLADHADPIEFGPNTGSISFPEIKKTKAYGVLLNHSEHRINLKEISKCVKLAKKYKLKTIVCSNSLNEALKIKNLNPTYLAIEPIELISGKISVSDAKPYLIKNASKKIKNLLVGAGIHTKNDFVKAISCGAVGILISSSIIKNKNPKKKLNEFIF